MTIGHCAGGHLAAWAATREHPRVAVTGVVSQAGVLDLQRARGAAASPTASSTASSTGSRPSVASPIERLPLGVPALLTHGGLDDIVPVEISAALRRGLAARTLIVEPDEDHFGHLDPDNPLWKAVLAWL